MSQSKESRVFILGAGCSVSSGYPMGAGLATELETFLAELPHECSRIRRSVDATLDLLRKHPGTETLDRLTARIAQDLIEWKRQRGSPLVDAEYLKRENLADEQTLHAKIATGTLFLAREDKARQRCLPGYKEFFTQILGGPPWTAARETDCHVLTFNYDRLFEIAFSESFPEFDLRNDPLYARDALNAGFDRHASEWSAGHPELGRFSFLKLHGSAGWWVKVKREGELGARRYWPAVPVQGMTLEKIEKSIPNEFGGLFGWSPLLAFPRERQESQE